MERQLGQKLRFIFIMTGRDFIMNGSDFLDETYYRIMFRGSGAEGVVGWCDLVCVECFFS